jgi:hypothetical protein
MPCRRGGGGFGCGLRNGFGIVGSAVISWASSSERRVWGVVRGAPARGRTPMNGGRPPTTRTVPDLVFSLSKGQQGLFDDFGQGWVDV